MNNPIKSQQFKLLFVSLLVVIILSHISLASSTGLVKVQGGEAVCPDETSSGVWWKYTESQGGTVSGSGDSLSITCSYICSPNLGPYGTGPGTPWTETAPPNTTISVGASEVEHCCQEGYRCFLNGRCNPQEMCEGRGTEEDSEGFVDCALDNGRQLTQEDLIVKDCAAWKQECNKIPMPPGCAEAPLSPVCSCEDSEYTVDDDVRCEILEDGYVVDYADDKADEDESFTHEWGGQSVICTYKLEEAPKEDPDEEPEEDPEEEPVYECTCPEDEYRPNQQVECTITDRGEPVDTVTHTYDGVTPSFVPASYLDLTCSFSAAEPEYTCGNCRMGRTSLTRDASRKYTCDVFSGFEGRTESLVGSYDVTVNYNGGGSGLVTETIEHAGQSVDCQIQVYYGCDSDGQLDGVCPTNCKSWEDPDCDFGRYGVRAIDTLLNAVGLPSVQEWWNDQLESIPALGTIYTALDSIPGTPEWFTDQVCTKGAQISDEKACGLVGLEEENCTRDWEGYRAFEDDTVVSLAARYETVGHYELRWRLGGMDEDMKYRIYLANIGEVDQEGSYNEYSLLPRDKRVIYPEDGQYAAIESLSYTYDSADEFTHLCVEFSGTGETLEELNELFGTSIGSTPYTCKKIMYFR